MMKLINQLGGKEDVLVLMMFLVLLFLINSSIRNDKIRFLVSALSSFFIVAQTTSLYFTQSFIDYQFYVHLNLRGVAGLQNLFVFQIIIAIIFFIALLSINFFAYYIFSKLNIQLKKVHKRLSIKFISYVCMILLTTFITLQGSFINASKTLLPLVVWKDAGSFRDILKKYNMPDYITPDRIECIGGNNIIVISMESIEKAFLDSSFASLTPNLNNLKNKWNFYSMQQNSGSGWTSASLYTSLTGFPAFFGVQGNNIFQTAYHSNITSISHVLNEAEYKTIYLNGNTDHAGVKEMLSILKFDKVIDYKNATKTGYQSHYGLRDKDLFRIAKEEIEILKQSNTPFALFISTTDTHFPDGIYDKRMESFISPKNSDLEFMVASLDYLVGDFISYLESKNILDNTTIILFPDHLKMGDPSLFRKSGERGLYIITNSDIVDLETIDLYQIDLPKIILNLSKINHNLKFLTDYISGDKEKFIQENLLGLTEINTNGILNPNIEVFNINNVSQNYNSYKKDTDRFIAHAGGEIEGNKYTNSKEALDLNYSKGFRLFELDIIQTSDGKFVAAHDWEHWKKITAYSNKVPVTKEQFLSKKILRKYTPLDMDAINMWFSEHKDAILVTDKINDPIKFSELFIDKRRLIMELFDLQSVDEGLTAGILSAMPSQTVIENLEKKNIEKFAQMGIKNVAISRRFIANNKSLLQEFKRFGIKAFVYHVNFDPGINEDYVLKYELDYVFGIYADEWNFE